MTSTYHTNFDQYSDLYSWPGFHELVGAWLRRFHNRTRVTLVPTLRQRDQLRAAGYRSVDVLGRGVDTELFHPQRRDGELRREWGVSDNDPVLIYLGRLALEKNIDLSVRAFEAVRAVNPRARMVVIGDGPERERLSNRPGIILAGMQRGEQLARHVASGDLFPFASTTETYGNVVTEALASGLGVIAYDYAAAHERIRHGHDGVLVPLHNEDTFISATRALAVDSRRSLTHASGSTDCCCGLFVASRLR